jgi:hypothetical protein
MKHRKNFTVTLAAIAVALWLPAVATADDTFDLKINKRTGLGRPAARVKMTLELAGPPVAAPAVNATKVSIGGGPAVAMPAAGTASGFTTLGDFFTFGKGAGNSVVIDYSALTSFAAPSNFCVLKAGANCDADGDGAADDPCDGSQTRSVVFTGPDVTSYHLSAYSSASDFACGSAYKRVSTADAPNPFAATIGVVATNNGRHPIDLLLVLDRSGSMDAIPSGGALSRWTLLRAAITTLVDRWDLTEPASGGEGSGDRIATVLFHTTASNSTAPIFKARAAWADVKASLPATTADLTALGAGMNLGITDWQADQKNDPVMIIMTDGVQNQNPRVQPDASLAADAVMGSPTVPLVNYQTPIHTIGFGTSTSVALLDAIAQRTGGGLGYENASAMGMSDTFADALVGALKGNTISLAHRERGTFVPPAGPLVPIVVDASTKRAVFSVEWLEPRAALDVRAFPPGMTPSATSLGATPADRRDAALSTVVAFDITTPAQIGTWQIRVAPRGSNFQTDTPTPYNLSAHFLEGRLSYTIAFTESDQGAGDRLDVRAEVAYDGLPLPNLPPNAVTVNILRPGEALGTILHDTKVPTSALTPPPGAADPNTPPQQKIAFLDANGQLSTRIEPAPASTITLTHTANGVYTGSFTNTSVQGLYRLNAILNWTDPRTGAVHREERLDRELRVKPDAASTRITTTDLGGGTFTITVVPRDRFGNYAGPGFGDYVTAVLNSTGTIAPGPPADPDQTGTYIFTVTGVPAGQTPDAVINYGGAPIGGTSTLSPSSGKWRAFVDAGLNSPDGALDGSFSVNAGIERMLTNNWSFEGILGYHTFDGPIVDPNAWQLSANAKYFFGSGAFRPFVNAGVGVYRIDPPDDTSFGLNAGAGLLYEVNSKWGVEGVYNFHSTDPLDWSTLQIGLRWHF